MTALERRVNMAAVFIPFAVTAAAVALFWGDWVGWSDVATPICKLSARSIPSNRPMQNPALK